MTIEGIIEGLKEAATRHDNDGVLCMYIKDAVDVLTQIEAQMDASYEAGKFDQLQDDYRTVLAYLKGGTEA